MARWSKSIVVPLDSLIKEKENTNRPIAARSAGTVGKWGKMGFTSTRTYAFKALATVGPVEAPESTVDVQATQTNDPPKPKKFFKSRNSSVSVDVIQTQIIQHLPRAPPSPIREVSPKKDTTLKIKIPKCPPMERKKSISLEKGSKEKSKKKKEEKKKLKPEAPPSRVISRQRKVVNYNEEDDEEERSQTPRHERQEANNSVPTLSNKIVPQKSQSVQEEHNSQSNQHQNEINLKHHVEQHEVGEEEEADIESENENEPVMEPPAITPKQSNIDHPPIVLRISKGTSRLISTDSEDVINSPIQQSPIVPPGPAIASTEELLSVLSGDVDETPITKLEEKASECQEMIQPTNLSLNATLLCSSKATTEPDINSVKIKPSSPDPTDREPSKYESLKIVIKTDGLKKAFISDKPEKKGKAKKNKKIVGSVISERHPTTPSPKNMSDNRTLMSPPPSEKDFDSQSSILGSISSKGTHQFPAVIPDDSCVIRSRGSSDVTSDLETSQHSSLVAPPSDIESRLESMMDCDDDMPPMEGVETSAFGGANNKLITINEEPLKEDILQVLTGDDLEVVNKSVEEQIREHENKNLTILEDKSKILPTEQQNVNVEEPRVSVEVEQVEEIRTRRVTRSSRGNTNTEITPTESVTPVEKLLATPKRKTRNNNNGNLRNNSNVLPPTRNYTRKRKIVQAAAPVEKVLEEKNTENSTVIDLPDAPFVTPHSKKKEAVEDMHNENDNKEIANTTRKVEEKEYKIKNKLKRTWYERDSKKVADNDESSIENQPTTKKFNSAKNEENLILSNSGYSRLRNSSKIATNNNIENGASPSSGQDDEKRSVKLVISKKKGSIFKSRALVSSQEGETNSGKKRAVYKHTWDDENKKLKSVVNTPTPSDSGDTVFEDDYEETAITKFSRFTKQNAGTFEDESITSVKCDRKAKEYYTVVRNVKTAHQIQEIGEYQEMKDDVDYILDALQPHNPISTRCLSALQLATKCMTPAFRMHVRAHGTVGKFFKALKDAKNDLSLGLCTATIMFVLSQDTLNIDLDRDSLELMINLLEANLNPSDEENMVYERNKQKVRELCEEIKSQGKATHLNLDSISAGTLAMETLLSLTSKKAGEWFKEELRDLGGLEHIIKTICDCCHQISDYVVSWTEILLDKLKTIERCLRVLENVSQQNEKNQDYILSYNNGHAVDTLFKLYKLCDSEIALYPTNDSTPKDNPGVVLREALVPTLKVLINLTHPFDRSAIGSALLGQRAGIFDTSFHILLQAPNYVPEHCIFDLSVLVLLLLINLTMYTIPNRTLIMKSHAPSDFGNQFDKVPAIKALIEYFYRCREQALLAAQNTDEILENPESNKKKPQSQEERDEHDSKILRTAGKHMEHTIKASYAGILIGHLISDSSENEIVIRSYLRENKFQNIVKVLEEYYNFMNLAASSEASVVSHIKSTKNLIDYFKKCDAHSNNDDNENQQNNSDSNNKNSNNIIAPSSSTTSSSISTRSATTRYYKSYSQR